MLYPQAGVDEAQESAGEDADVPVDDGGDSGGLVARAQALQAKINESTPLTSDELTHRLGRCARD